MKKHNYFLHLLLILISTGAFAQESVKIGTQTWTTKNLNVSTFQNGDTIKEVKTEKEWQKASKEGTPAWCYYENDPSNGEKHGKLYNWAAVTDPRGLAPVGFHIPSLEDWMVLIEYLGGEKKAGAELKSSTEWDGTNSTGFNALPSGRRYAKGAYGFGGEYADRGSLVIYWTSTMDSKKVACTFYLKSKKKYIAKMLAYVKDMGLEGAAYLSVRCVKD